MSKQPATTLASALALGVKPREVWAWAMFDFANSSYTTVVITAVFNAYFVAVVANNASWATLLWTVILGLSSALIMFSAPAIGAYADAHAAKKKLLLISTIGCVTATTALALVDPGDLALAVVLIIISNYFFGSGENIIAAFLPELAHEDGLGRVSGWGWSLGYLGGLLSLVLCLAYLSLMQDRGAAAVPFTMLITAALFAVSAIPTFVFLQERAIAQAPQAERQVLSSAFARVACTMQEAKHFVDMRRFLLCLVFYQSGIQAVITLAGIYAQQAMGFTMPQTIALIFVVNVTAAIGAFAFGYVQDRLGHIKTLALTLCGWIVMVLLAWAATEPPLFWLAANIAGLCMGASQSAGRALIGWLAPPARIGEFFGLWGLAVKFSAILGPVTYGLANWLSGGDHRFAILITGSYFVIGLAILGGIDVARGRTAALTEMK